MDNKLFIKINDLNEYYDKLFYDAIFYNKSEIEIDEKLAKKIYFHFLCNLNDTRCDKFNNWILENYNRNDLLDWNNKLVSDYLAKIENDVYVKKDFDAKRQYINLMTIMGIYFNDLDCLSRLIKLLETCCEIFGYKEFLLDFGYCTMLEKPLSFYFLSNIEGIKENHLNISLKLFYENTKYEGVLATLVYNNYFDLLENFIKNVLSPFINSFTDAKRSKIYMAPIVTFNNIYLECRKFLSETAPNYLSFFEEMISDKIKCFKGISNNNWRINCAQLLYLDNDQSFVTQITRLKNDIYVTNAKPIKDKNLTKFKLCNEIPATNLIVKKINVLYLDEELDIAIIEVKITPEFNFISPILKFDLKLSLGTYIEVFGSKLDLSQEITANNSVWVNDFSEFENIGKNNEFKTINNFSYGLLKSKNEKELQTNIPFVKQTYGAIAFSNDGKAIGIARSSSNGTDNLSIIPFVYIFNLMNELKI